MRAIQLTKTGHPPILSAVESPIPQANEVLVDVTACGLNFADLLMMKGEYQERPELPFIPGMEISGRVRALGEGVADIKVGDRVAAFTGYGGLAEQAIVPAGGLTILPDTMPLDVAAGFQVAYGTSHLALDHRARLRPGENLLVLGAAGGVGLTAVELGRAMGANVIACARGNEKLAIAKKAGAHHLIDSESNEIRETIKSLGGADVVYDPVGGSLSTDVLRAINPEGRMVIIGFASGDVPQFKSNILLVKNISLIGFYWGGYLKFRPEALSQSLGKLFDMHAAGKLSPHISHRMPLEQTADAFELLRARKSTGKVVVIVNQDLA